MKTNWLLATAVWSLTLPLPGAAWADEASWSKLNAQVVELHGRGRYAAALPVAQKALKAAEKEHGKDSPETALSLNNLALIRKRQGDYAEAIALYRRSLAIAEQTAGFNHPDLVATLSNIALLHEEKGEHEEADAIYRRVRQSGQDGWAAWMEERSGQMRQEAKTKPLGHAKGG